MSGDRLNDRLNDRLKPSDVHAKILKLIEADAATTAIEIASVLGVSESTVRRGLKELQEAGVVIREGSRKTGRWVVTIDGSEE